MKQFCKECGKETRPNDRICIHCGTSLDTKEVNEEVTRETRANKQPMSKKKKIIWGTVAGVIIVLFSLNMWATSYLSPEAVEQRFEAAVGDTDTKKLKKMVVHEDGSAISKQETNAFVELIKSEGKAVLYDLYTVAYNGKFLGIYDSYKIEIVDQFVVYDDLVDGLSFEFNGEVISEFEQDEAYVVYGPLAPGVYTVEAMFEGEYGETTMEDTLMLDNPYREYTSIGMDIPISKVTIHVENVDQFDVSKAHILLNEEEISISKEGETEEIGPFILDGSQMVKTVVTMPWGEITSEEIAVDESYMQINADLIAPDQYKEMTKTLKNFGEQYVNAFADKSTKVLKVANADVKKDLAKRFDDHYHYSGKLEKLTIDKDSITFNSDAKTPKINVLTKYIFKEDEHQLSEKANLHEEEYIWNMGLSFDKEEKKWTVTSQEYASTWGGFETVDEIEGSKKLHGPSEAVVADAKTQGLEAEIEQFLVDYTEASVDAINYRDFDLVEHYISEKGPRRKESKEYIDYLDSKDIYEEWYGTELEKLEKVNDTTYKATIIEEFDIIKPDTSAVKKFRTVVNVKVIDGEYYVDELLETNEI